MSTLPRVLAIGFFLSATTRVALAHPILDEAQRSYEAGNLEGVLSALDQAESATDLTRDDLLSVLIRRAMVHHALGASAERDLEFRRLCSMFPRYVLDASQAPNFRDAFLSACSEIHDPISLESSVAMRGDKLVFDVHVRGDVAQLVRRVELRVQGPTGEWRTFPVSPPAHVEVAGRFLAPVRYEVRALGPGGATITESSGLTPLPRTQPERMHNGPAPIGDATDPRRERDESSSGGAWLWIAASAGAALAIATVIIITQTGSDETRVEGPIFP